MLTHVASGRKYVGQSINIEARISNHPYGTRGALAKAIKEFGWDAFSHEIIETCDSSRLNAAEAKWVDHFDCMTPRGFNSTEAGRCGLRGGDINPKTGAQRQAASVARGRQIAVVLRDPVAIDALDKLVEKHRGVTAAVTAALIHAATRARST